MPRLFDMSDADIDRAVEAHWDRVWEEQNDDSGQDQKHGQKNQDPPSMALGTACIPPGVEQFA